MDVTHATTSPYSGAGPLDDEVFIALSELADGGGPLDLGRRLHRRAPGVDVHLALQPSLARFVVVQRPRPDASQTVIDGLRREARLIASLDHPNILPVHDIREEIGRELQVLVPNVPGRTWSKRLSQPHVVREHFGVADLLSFHVRVLLQVCRAVAYAHEQGIVHRDLRPESVWVGDVGEVYVVQWSLAVPFKQARCLTPDELARVGGAGMFAPEMVMRSAGRIGPRTDVYQLGGLLYHVLTGAPPHPGDTVDEAVRHVLFQDPDIPTDAPPSLARVCKRALARNPAARYPDVRSFQQALEAALAQRTAYDLAQRADAAAEDLRHLLRQTEPDPFEIVRTWGAVRFGYETALAEAPDLAIARMRLERSAEQVVRWALVHDDAESAANLLAHMDDPPEHLLAEVGAARSDQTASASELQPLVDHVRVMDPAVDASHRLWLSAVLGLAWVPAPLTLHLTDEPDWSWLLMIGTLGLLAVVGLAAGHAVGAPRSPSALNRLIASWAAWGPLVVAALVATAWALDLPPEAGHALIALGGFMVVATAASVIDVRLLGAAVTFGAAFLVMLVLPDLWTPALCGSSLVLALSLVGLARAAEVKHVA